MAKGFPKEMYGVRDGASVPVQKASGILIKSRQRADRASFDLSDARVAKASGDTNYIGTIPKGHRFAGVRLTTSVTLGAATVAIGIAGNPTFIRDAAVLTTVDQPTLVAKAAAMGADPVTDDTEVFMTIGAAALPGAGTVVAELFYTGR